MSPRERAKILRVVERLNEGTTEGLALRDLVGPWVAANCDPVEFLRRHPIALRELGALANGKTTPRGLSNPAFALLMALPLDSPLERRKARKAGGNRQLFCNFLMSSGRRRIRLCAHSGCQKYFLSDHARKIYCSRGCARHVSASASVRRSRATDLRMKIQKAQGAMREFEELDRQPKDWKAWVARRAGVGVTPKWITRHVNLGNLR